VAFETSPVCFRLSLEDRDLLDMVAKHQKRSVSAFVRDAAVRQARDVLRDREADLLAEYRAENDRLARELADRTERVSRLARESWPQPRSSTATDRQRPA
jgi:uncharacterized protein (DUF1778 family)